MLSAISVPRDMSSLDLKVSRLIRASFDTLSFTIVSVDVLMYHLSFECSVVLTALCMFGMSSYHFDY